MRDWAKRQEQNIYYIKKGEETMEYGKIQQYFKEAQYEDITVLAAKMEPTQIQDTDIIRKVAESYRKLGKIPECISWLERLVIIKPESRYIDKLKDLY